MPRDGQEPRPTRGISTRERRLAGVFSGTAGYAEGVRRLESLFRLIDRIGGGRDWEHEVPGAAVPAARRRLVAVCAILAFCLLLGAGTVVAVFWMFLHGAEITLPVWIRGLVILGITASLFYFVWRAWIGKYWAFRRLQLFTRVFPVIALALSAVPGLFPLWMIVEQLVFAALLIVAAFLLSAAPMRAAFPRPERPARRKRRRVRGAA